MVIVFNKIIVEIFQSRKNGSSFQGLSEVCNPLLFEQIETQSTIAKLDNKFHFQSPHMAVSESQNSHIGVHHFRISQTEQTLRPRFRLLNHKTLELHKLTFWLLKLQTHLILCVYLRF